MSPAERTKSVDPLNLIQLILAEGKTLKEATSRTRILAEISVTVALSLVLNYIKIFHLPQGGSITLGSMVPVLLISYRRGLRVGVFTGAVFGLAQMVLDGWIYNPFGMFLDYPLAFGALGLAGLFRRYPLVGVAAALVARFISHFLSGVLFFWMYAPEGMSPIVYSAIYNGSYILPEMVISGIIIYLIVQRNLLNLSL
jgi:thiamine transporter